MSRPRFVPWLIATSLLAGACAEDDAARAPEESTATSELSTAGAVLTMHNDSGRTGLDTTETTLTWANVPAAFGRLFTAPVDGRLYAQPLFAPGVATPLGVRDVVYVETEANTAYAIDAYTGQQIWSRNFGTPIPSTDAYPTQCMNIPGTIGITGTPVIDPVAGTIYFVSATKELGVYHQRLNALDVKNGAPRPGSPHEITAQVPGDGPAAPDGWIRFDALRENQRPGLLLLNGVVTVGWASHCSDAVDYVAGLPEIYQGWLMSFDAVTLQPLGVFNSAPHADPSNAVAPYGSGIWHGAGGIASDGNRIFANTGNGLFQPGLGDWGDTTLAFDNNLNLVDFFTPYDQVHLYQADLDMSAGGIVVVPTSSPAHPHLLATSGKEGSVYVLDRDALGGEQPTANDRICPPSSSPGNCAVARGYHVVGQSTNPEPYYGLPAYFNGNLYYAGHNDHMKMFAVGGSAGLSGVLAQTATTFGYPGSTPSISANGTSDGIVWAIERTAPDPFIAFTSHLHAYRADTLAELYNSATHAEDPDHAGQFVTPTIAAGHVYIGTSTSLTVYGRLVFSSPAATSVLQGGSVPLVVGTESTNPAVTYTVAATGAPAGSTISLSPTSFASGGASNVTFTAGAATTPGTYAITFTVTAGGVSHTAVSQITVVHRDNPPTAAFTYSCTGRTCTFNGTGSTDAEGPITSYTWDFGDAGPGGSGATTSHTYATNTSPTVTLTVRDSANQPGSISHVIEAIDQAPVSAFSVVCTGRTCAFDGTFSHDAEGPISSYAWDYGDGSPTGSGATTSHTYASNASRIATLVVRDSVNQTGTASHAFSPIDHAPVAAFTFNCAILNCTFNGAASSDAEGPIATYSWNFGDGSALAAGATQSHTYTALHGTYTVTLTVTDSVGQSTSVSHSVTAQDLAPIAQFTTTCITRTCYPDASASYDDIFIANYVWHWGDGTMSSGGSLSTPSHTYAADGIFLITLDVVDSAGQLTSIGHKVHVIAGPTAAFTFSCVGRTCTFDASGTTGPAPITNYHWDWDDESTADAATPTTTHTFAYGATFDVQLIATDKNDAIAVIRHGVTVN